MNIIPGLVHAVEKFAPAVASSLFGPGGGIAVSLLENTFGCSAPDLPAHIANDPDAALKLKTLEDHHGEALASIASTDYVTEVSDRLNARLVNDSHFFILATLSIIFIVGFFAFIGMMLSRYFPDQQDSHQVFDILSNSTMLILSYWFGSCHNKK